MPEEKTEAPVADAAPVEREESAPEQPQTTETEELVNLPLLISDEYGMSRSEARQMCAVGEIEIDGKTWTGDRFDVAASAVMDKTIKVTASPRAVQFQYKGPGRDRFTGDRFQQ